MQGSCGQGLTLAYTCILVEAKVACDGVITHLEPDILECEVKWALGSITTNKARGGEGIPADLFQILKHDALSVPANLENSAVATGLDKVSFHSNPKERQCQRKLTITQLHSSPLLVK